jgi:hypothetical protein
VNTEIKNRAELLGYELSDSDAEQIKNNAWHLIQAWLQTNRTNYLDSAIHQYFA